MGRGSTGNAVAGKAATLSDTFKPAAVGSTPSELPFSSTIFTSGVSTIATLSDHVSPNTAGQFAILRIGIEGSGVGYPGRV